MDAVPTFLHEVTDVKMTRIVHKIAVLQPYQAVCRLRQNIIIVHMIMDSYTTNNLKCKKMFGNCGHDLFYF